MAQEIKAALEDLHKTFAEFQAANDERLKEKADKGSVDALLDEKVDKINAAVSEAQDKVSALNKEQETQKSYIEELEAKLNRGQVGAGGQGSDNVAKNAARFHSLINLEAGNKPVGEDEADVDAYLAYRDAFATYLRRGDNAVHPDVRAALSVGSDPDGGYFVDPVKSDRIISRLFETSEMRSVANVITIGSDAIEYPTDTNEASSGGWVGETGSRSETDTPQVGTHRIPVHEQYAQPKITQKLLDDAQFDIEGWLEMKVADKLTRTENTAFVSGNGVAKPRGFLDYKSSAVTTDDDSRSWGVLQYTPSGASGAFPTVSGSTASDPDALITMISKLKPFYRPGAVWTMNRAVEAAVRKLKDADGRYFVGMGDIRDGVVGFNLFGFPIVTMEDMPDLSSDSYSIAFGNFGVGYQIVDRQGIRVLRDPFTSKPYIKMYTTKRVGGDVIDYDAIKLMKFATS